MYNQFHTEQAVYVMNLAIRQLEELDEMNSHMSGNGKDTILECYSRIATSEPDNPLYPVAAARMFDLSVKLDEVRRNMAAVIDIVGQHAVHFKVFDADESEWLHETDDRAEAYYMDDLETI